MSRITSGKMQLDVQTVMPTTFIQAAIDTVQPAADAKGIRLVRILDHVAGPISGDSARLQQVLWNLLSNAIKFTPKDGRVQVTLERVNSHIEISVADTGIGIKPEFLPQVFDRFQQADASITRRHGGLGIGLSIVKHLVELHGGTVHVSSPGENLGATFGVHLPLMVVRRAASPSERLHPRVAPPPLSDFEMPDLKGVRVLVVDDEPDARTLIGHVLKDCGADLRLASDANEALALLQQELPDVIISDIGMPEIDGYEFLRRARVIMQASGQRVPAIALTAFARSEDRTGALHAGYLLHFSMP